MHQVQTEITRILEEKGIAAEQAQAIAASYDGEHLELGHLRKAGNAVTQVLLGDTMEYLAKIPAAQWSFGQQVNDVASTLPPEEAEILTGQARRILLETDAFTPNEWAARLVHEMQDDKLVKIAGAAGQAYGSVTGNAMFNGLSRREIKQEAVEHIKSELEKLQEQKIASRSEGRNGPS